jgi:hypothetical protein
MSSLSECAHCGDGCPEVGVTRGVLPLPHLAR